MQYKSAVEPQPGCIGILMEMVNKLDIAKYFVSFGSKKVFVHFQIYIIAMTVKLK